MEVLDVPFDPPIPLEAPLPIDLEQGEETRRFGSAVLVFVEHGVVALISSDGSRRRVVVAVAPKGHVLPPPGPGESVLAVTAARLRPLDAGSLNELLRTPEAALSLLDGLAEALRERQESLANFASPIYSERLRAKLLQLARAHGRVVPGGVRIDLPLTHQLLAEMIGAARETVTVALRKLRQEGFVVRAGRVYTIAVAPDELL